MIFDLDGTLVVEHASVEAAFAAAAALANDQTDAAADTGIDAVALVESVRRRAGELWWASPLHDFARSIAISSWEGLWCGFEGEGPELAGLREWAPAYRRSAWDLALREQGVEDIDLAERLGDAYISARRAIHTPYPDARPVLEALRGRYRLGLLTNGHPTLQRLKLTGSGLDGQLDQVLVGGDIRSRKPSPDVFETILGRLGCAPGSAVMVGDSLESDVEGALAAGIAPIWLRRPEDEATGEQASSHGAGSERARGAVSISGLGELEGAIARLR